MKDTQATEDVSSPQEKTSTSPNQSCGLESEAWNFFARSDLVGSYTTLSKKLSVTNTHFHRKLYAAALLYPGTDPLAQKVR
jgi:hypothetical protein